LHDYLFGATQLISGVAINFLAAGLTVLKSRKTGFQQGGPYGRR